MEVKPFYKKLSFYLFHFNGHKTCKCTARYFTMRKLILFYVLPPKRTGDN